MSPARASGLSPTLLYNEAATKALLLVVVLVIEFFEDEDEDEEDTAVDWKAIPVTAN